MLLNDQSHGDFLECNPVSSFGEESTSSLSSSTRPVPSKSDKITVHLVAGETQRRASMARAVFASGHHAEVYATITELLEHRPQAGLVFIDESEKSSAAIACDAFTSAGLWLPVIGVGETVAPERIVQGMKAGAVEFLIGSFTPNTISRKISDCAKEAELQHTLRLRRAQAKVMLEKLSTREREVLDKLITGLSNKEIARSLNISPRTVEIHRMKMMGKLGANSAAEAIRMRIESELG